MIFNNESIIIIIATKKNNLTVKKEWNLSIGGLIMAARNIQATSKDKYGVITYLCNIDELWSPRHKNDVILDLESNMHSYYILIAGNKVDIHVIDGPSGKYLRTDPDKTENNNLNELPSC